MLVAITIIGTVMAAAAPFMTRSLSLSALQRTRQAAIQIAGDGLERVRALDPSSLLTGRGQAEVQAQWDAAPAEVTKLFPFTKEAASDPMMAAAALGGSTAPLPTQPVPVTISNVAYKQNFYVGRCYQNKVTSAAPLIGTCGTTSTGLPFFWAVVSVTWQQNACPSGGCVVVASTLVSTGTDPVFDINTAAPSILDPVAQKSYLNQAASLQMSATGGRLPFTWSATGLPAGLTIDPSSGLISGTPTAGGTSTVSVKVVDRDKRADTSTFTWTVAAPPTLTSPGAQVSRTGTALSLAVAQTGGIAPFKWTQTGLPAGLTIDAATGVISGTPTTANASAVPVTVSVTDSGAPAQTVTVSFTWRVLTPVTLASPGAQTATNGTVVTYNLGAAAAGGLKPYSWVATGLPDGTTIDAATGNVTGRITHGTRYITTVTVTDAAGGSATIDVIVSVTQNGPNDLRITAPTGSTQTSASGKAASLTPAAAGTGPYTWSATGLPAGLTINSSTGAITGTPTAKGTSKVTLTVKSATTVANLMFLWTVT